MWAATARKMPAEDADVQTVHVAREALGPAVAGGPGANGRVGDIDRAEVGFLAGAQLLRAGGGEPQPSSIPQRAWHEVVSREAVKGLACRFSGSARPRGPNYLRRRTRARACSSFRLRWHVCMVSCWFRHTESRWCGLDHITV